MPSTRSCRFIALAAAALTLAACGQSAPPEDAAAGSTQARYPYPPGGAKVLSITGGTEVPGNNPYSVAVNCATALQVTAQAVDDFAVPVGDAERDGLRRAQAIYRERANTAAERKGLSERDVTAEIEKKVQQATDDPAPQVQLTGPCLRTLVGPEGSGT